MGKKKKKDKGMDMYEMDTQFDDPAAIDAFVRKLAAEGEFGFPSTNMCTPSVGTITPSTPAMNPVQPPLSMSPQLHNTQRQPVSSVITQPNTRNIPKQPKPQPKKDVQKAPVIQMANYGRLRFELITNAYGPSLLFSDAFGNSIVRPIVMRGVDAAWDKADYALPMDELYEAVSIVYQLTKLRMYPDAVFALNPEGTDQFIHSMEILDPDNILSFISNSGVVSYVVNLGYINDIVAPKVIELIRSVGGNVIYTLDNFVPREDYVTDTFRVFIDHYVVEAGQTETALNNYMQYTSKYCTFHDRHKTTITDSSDILDDYDSVYGGLVTEFERLFSEAIDATDTDPTPDSGNSMIDPNMEQAASATEYPVDISVEMEGATNDEEPFLGKSDNVTVSVSTTETATVTVHSGNDGDASTTNEPSGYTGPDEVSNSDVASVGDVQPRIGEDGSERRGVSGSCTTNLGDLLKNALKENEEEAGTVGNPGGLHATEAWSKDTEKGSPGVQPGGSVNKQEKEQKEKEEEKRGDMVISVTTCG